MKIISGSLKGRVIPSYNNSKYRPSTAKFKESLFSILTSIDANLFKNKFVLDLCAGTGSLGLEALSRGAGRVTFIDIENEHVKIIKDFLHKIDHTQNTDCLRLDSTNLPLSHVSYDIIFLDPPYNKNIVTKTINSLSKKGWLKPGSLLIIEMGNDEIIKFDGSYEILLERVIGRAKLIIMRNLSEAA